MNNGAKKDFNRQLRRARRAKESQMKVYEALANNHRSVRTRVDILETFAGNAPLSSKAHEVGHVAATPMDYDT